jgi:hypothetical protein
MPFRYTTRRTLAKLQADGTSGPAGA